MEMVEYLRKHYMEPMPKWLENFQPGQPIDINEVLKSRIVYYPGAGEDGQPVKTCMKSSSAHVFIYVDYWFTPMIITKLLKYSGFLGYHEINTIVLSKRDIFKSEYIPFIVPDKWEERKNPFVCIMKIFERNDNKTEKHGSKRFAVIFLCADGIASYKSIFCDKNRVPPYIVVLRDHGSNKSFFSEDDWFSKGGQMEKYAKESSVFPKFLFVGTTAGTTAWEGYKELDCINDDNGRYIYLYEKI